MMPSKGWGHLTQVIKISCYTELQLYVLPLNTFTNCFKSRAYWNYAISGPAKNHGPKPSFKYICKSELYKIRYCCHLAL